MQQTKLRDCGAYPCDGSCRCRCGCHMEDLGDCTDCDFYDRELSCDVLIRGEGNYDDEC